MKGRDSHINTKSLIRLTAQSALNLRECSWGVGAATKVIFEDGYGFALRSRPRETVVCGEGG